MKSLKLLAIFIIVFIPTTILFFIFSYELPIMPGWFGEQMYNINKALFGHNDIIYSEDSEAIAILFCSIVLAVGVGTSPSWNNDPSMATHNDCLI